MKQRIIKSLSLVLVTVMLISVLCAAPVTVSAAVTEQGTFHNINYKVEDGTLTISGSGATDGNSGEACPWSSFSDDVTKIVIEEGITDISRAAFYVFLNVTEVSLPSTLKTIGVNAFYKNRSLESIVFPDDLGSIGRYAFAYCDNLKSINFPDNCVFNSYAFYNCGFKSLAFPQTYEGAVKSHCFEDCKSLQMVTVIGNVDLSARCLFSGCDKLGVVWIFNNSIVKSVGNAVYNKDMTRLIFYIPGVKDAEFTVPDGVTSIAEYSFYKNKNLQKINIASGTTVIEECAFSGCENLFEITLPGSLKSIGKEAFRSCPKLNSITIPDKVTAISEFAFADCGSLKNINIGKGLKKLSPYLFANCSGIEEIEIPGNITEIGNKAFYGDKNLKRLFVPSSVTVINEAAFGFDDYNGSGYVRNTGLTVYGYAGSTAESYCRENRIKFRLIGDVNGDNAVDVLDATLVQKYSAGKAELTSEQIYCADVNKDKTADVLDAANIQKYAAGKTIM